MTASVFIIVLSIMLVMLLLCGCNTEVDSCNCSSSDSKPHIETSTEKQLTRFLINHYQQLGKGGRPVVKTSTATKVKIMFGLYDLNLDENEKVLTTSMWVYITWRDEYLLWDPKDYGGLKITRLESHEIWTPDIMLYNTAEPDSKHRNSLIRVNHNGTIDWNKHQIFKSSCALNVIDFPFDTQVCHMVIGPWTHTVNEVDLDLINPKGIDLDIFMDQYGASNEWNITQLVAQREIDFADNCVLKYELHLQRKMVFSSYILTLPCVFLASLTLVVFCLPPERPDRTGLGMSLFSSFLVLLLILVEAAPSSAASVPKLGIYYCCNMVIIMMSIFLSSVVVNLHKTGKSQKRVPYSVRLIFLKILGRILLVTPLDLKNICLFHMRGKPSTKQLSIPEENFSLISHKLQTDGSPSTPEAEVAFNDTYDTPGGSQTTGIENLLLENVTRVTELKEVVKKLLDYIRAREKIKHEHGQIIDEWHQLAKVVDRLLFVLYLFAITVSMIYTFPEPPIIKQWKM